MTRTGRRPGTSDTRDQILAVAGRKIVEVCGDLATTIPVRLRPRGRVETFQATTAAASDPVKISTDDYASVLLRFEANLRGVMTVSQGSAGHKAALSFEINGSDGSLAWNSESPNQLWIGHRTQANQELPKDPSLMMPAARGYSAYPGGHTEGYPDTFLQLFKDFYSHIEKGKDAQADFPTFQTGHDELCCARPSPRARASVGGLGYNCGSMRHFHLDKVRKMTRSVSPKAISCGGCG